MKRAIIIGATSGIGKELALVLAREGYSVGITGRRLDMLQDLKSKINSEAFIKQIDLCHPEEACELISELIEDMGGIDLMVINSGVGIYNKTMAFEPEKQTIDVNVSGFVAMAALAYRYFAKNGGGHIVGVSSVAALRGHHAAPAYNASKAFVSNYMEGLRVKAIRQKTGIYITDIRPGFVDTPMTKQNKGMFWVATPQIAAEQIYSAIKRKQHIAYVTRRWKLIAWLYRIMPFWVVKKL